MSDAPMPAPSRITQEAYEQARRALNGVIWSFDATPEQIETAKAARDELTAEYIGQQIDDVNARTAQFQAFIAQMEEVIGAIGADSPLEGVRSLRRVVEQARAALAPLAPPPSGARGRKKGARSAAVTARPRVQTEPTLGPGVRTVLCIHGVGDHHSDPSWQFEWRNAILSGLDAWRPGPDPRIEFVVFDHLFERHELDAATIAKAIWKLGVSGMVHGIGDMFRRRRGLLEIPERLRWTAGMVAQWAESEALREELRTLIREAVERTGPDLVCAHSLGSLAAYDSFTRAGRGEFRDTTFVSFGSQIGNPFVRSIFGGRIDLLPALKTWRHLYNQHDDAFTHPIMINPQRGTNGRGQTGPKHEVFRQISADFDIRGILDHDAVTYLRHANVVNTVWREMAGVAEPAASPEGVSARAFGKVAERPTRRALLIGINEYPNPEDRLEGCVNDVFLVSSVLQEVGFAAEHIRVVLDERATARGIRDRIEWLLDGVKDGDERFLYYSGHGAQIPAYGEHDEVDHLDECLVPHDFDWSADRAITDDHLIELYSQLPYGAAFTVVFDCCHSGGMSRDGGRRIRGLAPPDDVRHRALKWNKALGMWEERRLDQSGRAIGIEQDRLANFAGERGATHRLGRAIPLRSLSRPKFEQVREDSGHHGPFMPIIFEACQEKEFAYEYRHGVISHGAFTFSMCQVLRATPRGERLTYNQLLKRVATALETLEYDQRPSLVAPTALRNKQIPWLADGTAGEKRAKPVRKRKA
jgi:hypothetical protein